MSKHIFVVIEPLLLPDIVSAHDRIGKIPNVLFSAVLLRIIHVVHARAHLARDRRMVPAGSSVAECSEIEISIGTDFLVHRHVRRENASIFQRHCEVDTREAVERRDFANFMGDFDRLRVARGFDLLIRSSPFLDIF